MKDSSSATDKLLAALLSVLGIGGLAGAIPFIMQPDGSLLGMDTSLLERSPVDNYLLPGIFLLVVMVLWPFANFYGILAKKSWASASVVMLGIVTMAWIIYETITIRTFSPLQPLVFIIGLGLLVGGLKKINY